jgi:predicted dehydrogenase
MRILMIGSGSIGRRHMASLRLLVPSVRFDVLREAGRGRDTAGLGEAVEVVGSLDEALVRRPDLMVVASPSSMHLRPLLAAIDSGTPFYAEKPVVTTSQDLAVLEARAARGGLPPNLVGCNLRFLPSLAALKALVAEGRLGRVVRADFEAGQWLPDWRPAQDYRRGYSASREMGGGVLLDLIHEIDAALWLFGGFDRVEGFATRASDLDIDSDDCASLVLARAGGPIATVRIDYVSRRPMRRYTLVGDRATATWDLRAATLQVADAGRIETLLLPEGAFDVAATYPAAMREMLGAIDAGRPSAQPLEQGLRALATALRAQRIEP